MRREENEKFEQNSICKACEEIVQYYCYYHWCGLISRPFHYLTTTKKLTYKQQFWRNPQISCASKKDESEEVEKKLQNEYEPLIIKNYS